MAIKQYPLLREYISVSLASGVVSATFSTRRVIPTYIYVPTGLNLGAATLGFLEFKAIDPSGTTYTRTFNSAGTTFQVVASTAAAMQYTFATDDWKGPKAWRVVVEDSAYAAVTQAGSTVTFYIGCLPIGAV